MQEISNKPLTGEEYKTIVLEDYKLATMSRQASLLGRKEVLTGKAKFGIFGDGKEIAQIAMAKAFENGDFRSGYYRDQTFMMAIGELTVKQFFAQLYAHPSIEKEPASGGRQMNGHFANRTLDENGEWKNLLASKNSSADISPTAGQMLRLVGLGYASKLYRNNKDLHNHTQFSNQGNEVAFGTIGNASTAEGHFWESVNACGLLNVPVVISIWDDEYGISVSNKYQITKQNLSELLSGFSYDEEKNQGYHIYRVKGWDYPSLVEAYTQGVKTVREHHIPAIYHIVEMTQPQGHSTSGSHERYKSKERLAWEQEYDCLVQMRIWMLKNGIASEEELNSIDNEAKEFVKKEQKEAWSEFIGEIKEERAELIAILQDLLNPTNQEAIQAIIHNLETTLDNDRRATFKSAWDGLLASKNIENDAKEKLKQWFKIEREKNHERYSSSLHTGKALEVKEVKPIYSDEKLLKDGREILLGNFDKILENKPEVFIFGEDVGGIGDVNQGLAGMQAKYGEIRVTDTGIREATIAGQGIGAAMRGLRPIAEIQYLDYLLYCLQVLSDDASTVLYRTAAGQKAPLIIRTRGHRLEGVWHSGSPMGTIINACRGMYVCVPRNMTQAAGMYNTLLQADEPAIVVERLNAYRIKEELPTNLGEFTTPLGVPEVLRKGSDLTIVTYGPCCDIALEAAEKLSSVGIEVEIIDVQTLLPFDIHHIIVEHIKVTNRVLFLDEDVPGGASAYMLQQVVEKQGGYKYLDSEPATLSSQPHRPAYGTDGDYFSKPNAEDVFRKVYEMLNEVEPKNYPIFW
jgi:pyruvate/2-oxoglutarate/acetoin dehydrogenase E1 component/TPP-dependent pyruvate/acetoin dehydrogenase alpha subunit